MKIIVDTREQTPFLFKSITPAPTVVRATLKTGDYSLDAYQDKIAIERKSLPDFLGSVGSGRARFVRELERGADMDFFAVVIEASWPDIIAEIKVNHPKMSSKSVYASCIAWNIRYGVHVYPCPSRGFAEVTTYRILQRYYEDNHGKKIIGWNLKGKVGSKIWVI